MCHQCSWPLLLYTIVKAKLRMRYFGSMPDGFVPSLMLLCPT